MEPALLGCPLDRAEELGARGLELGCGGLEVVDEELGDRAGREVRVVDFGWSEDLELGESSSLLQANPGATSTSGTPITSRKNASVSA